MCRIPIGETELGAILISVWSTHETGVFIPINSSYFEIIESKKCSSYRSLIVDSNNKIKLFEFQEYKELYPNRVTSTWRKRKIK